jgi:hypothetical protein
MTSNACAVRALQNIKIFHFAYFLHALDDLTAVGIHTLNTNDFGLSIHNSIVRMASGFPERK